MKGSLLKINSLKKFSTKEQILYFKNSALAVILKEIGSKDNDKCFEVFVFEHNKIGIVWE